MMKLPRVPIKAKPTRIHGKGHGPKCLCSRCTGEVAPTKRPLLRDDA